MSILIKGLKMPEDCPQCPLSHWNKLDQLTGCELVRRYVPESESSYWQSDKRPEWCPLVGLPDHGDLIDRSRLIGGFADWYIQESPMYLGDSKVVAETIGDAMKAIEAAPVVIPAERSEDD